MKTYKLNFENYHSSISAGLVNFQQNEDFVDMTIAADGHLVNVHRNIISLASPYIREMIKLAPCPHPVVYLSNIKYDILKILLEYIYTGKVEVPDSNFNQLVHAAKELHIVGLTGLMKINVGSYEQKRTLNEVNKSQSYVPDIKPQISTVNVRPLNDESEDAYNEDQCYAGADEPLNNDYLLAPDQNISLAPSKIIFENACNTEYMHEVNPIPSTEVVQANVNQLLHITNIETANVNAFAFNNQVLHNNQNPKYLAHKSITNEQYTTTNNQITENFTAYEPNVHNENQNNEECNQSDYQLKLKYSGTDSENCTNDGNTENAKEISINLSEIVNRGKRTEAEIILGKPMFALSIRGQLQVIFNRYIYYIIYSSEMGKRRFKCIDYRSKRCPAIIVMQHSMITERKNVHCHGFHDDKINKKLQKQILYESIEEALQSSRDETEKLKQIREIENNHGLVMDIDNTY